MLKFRKIISLILSVAMLLSVCSVGVSADWLTEDDSDAIEYEGEVGGTTGEGSNVPVYDYTKVVNVLRSLGIIDDKISATGTLTRAQFAAEMIHVLNVGDNLSGVVSDVYTDVDESTNYAGEISACYELGIMHGYTDGSFGPDDTITYGQAVKSLVCLLGYGVMTAPDSDFADFLIIANSYKITKQTYSGVNDYITGGELAQMIFNALEVFILNRTAGGYIDNYSNEAGDTILKRHDITKIEGVVYENDVTSLTGVSTLRDGRVRIDSTICNANGTDIGTALGNSIKAYAITDEYGEKEPQIVYYEVTAKNEVIEIDGDDLIDIEGNGDLSKTVYYFDGATELKLTVDKKADIIYQNLANPDFDITSYTPVNGYLKFMDNDSDGIFDIVSIKEYETYTIESIGATNYNVNFSDSSITLDPKDGSYDFVITKNGTPGDFSSLSVGDVVSLATGVALDGKIFMEVNASSTKIIGTINEVEEDSGDRYITVGINTVKVLPVVTAVLNPGKDGTFYLDFKGKVADIASSAGSNQYGYVVGMVNEKGISGAAKLKILAVDGTVREYKTRDIVNLDGTGRVEATLLTTGANAAKIESQLIMYKTNYDGEITDIVTKENPTQDADGGLALYQEAGITDASGFDTTLVYRQYNSNVPLFFIGNAGTITDYAGVADKDVVVSDFVGKDNTIRINSSTLVFVVPLDEEGADDSKYTVNTSAYFKNGQFYYTEMFNVDEETNTAGVVLVRKNSSASIVNSAVPAMISGVTRKIDEDGMEYYEVAFVDKSGANSYRVSDELIKRTNVVSSDSDMSPTKLVKGDIVRYVIYDNEIDKIERVMAYSENITTKTDNGNYRAEPSYTTGEVVRIDDTIVTIRFMYNGEYRLRHYNTSPVKNIVIYDALGNGGKGEVKSGVIGELELGNKICIRSSDGYVTSVFGFIQD